MTERNVPIGYNLSWEHPVGAKQLVEESRANGEMALSTQAESIRANQSSLEDHIAGIQSPGAIIGGLTLVNEFTASAVANLVIDGITSTYSNYRLLVSGFSNTANNLQAQVRASGTAATTAYYLGLTGWTWAGAAANVANNNINGWNFGNMGVFNTSGFILDIQGISLASPTTITMIGNSNGGSFAGGGVHTTATAYNEMFFYLSGAGTFSGTFRLYGYRQA